MTPVASLLEGALARRFIEEHGAGGTDVERRDLADHRDADEEVAAAQHQRSDALALGAEDERERDLHVDLPGRLALLRDRPADPQAGRLELLERARDVGDERDARMLG